MSKCNSEGDCKIGYKQKIFRRMRRYYQYDSQANDWYEKPWNQLDPTEPRGGYRSPCQAVEDGEGQRVLDLIKHFLGE